MTNQNNQNQKNKDHDMNRGAERVDDPNDSGAGHSSQQSQGKPGQSGGQQQGGGAGKPGQQSQGNPAQPGGQQQSGAANQRSDIDRSRDNKR